MTPELTVEPGSEKPVRAISRGAVSGGTWAAIAVVLVALNFRPAIVAVTPVLDTISSELGLTSVLAGLLVTLPVLCFGVLGPIAPLLAGKIGFERSLALVLLAIIAGSAMRIIPSIPALFGGTLLVGAGIAVGNILLPGLIKRDFPHRLGIMSGLFSMSMAVGATFAAGLTIPIAKAVGWSWNEVLAAWGLFALIAFFLQRAHKAQGGELPEDILTADIDDGDTEVGFYSPWSWWPMMLASGAGMVFLGIAIGAWIAYIGAVVAAVSIVGWTYEYYRGNFGR